MDIKKMVATLIASSMMITSVVSFANNVSAYRLPAKYTDVSIKLSGLTEEHLKRVPLSMVLENMTYASDVYADETSEPTSSDNETSEPTASGGETSEPTASDSETSEPTASGGETSEPTASDSETSEPTSSDSETSEPTASDNETSEPTASGGETSEPTASDSETSEPAASDNETSEPTTSDNETSEPTTSDNETSEPTASGGETSEPTASDSETSEPTASDNETSEPTASGGETSEPTASDNETSEPTTSDSETENAEVNDERQNGDEIIVDVTAGDPIETETVREIIHRKDDKVEFRADAAYIRIDDKVYSLSDETATLDLLEAGGPDEYVLVKEIIVSADETFDGDDECFIASFFITKNFWSFDEFRFYTENENEEKVYLKTKPGRELDNSVTFTVFSPLERGKNVYLEAVPRLMWNGTARGDVDIEVTYHGTSVKADNILEDGSITLDLRAFDEDGALVTEQYGLTASVAEEAFVIFANIASDDASADAERTASISGSGLSVDFDIESRSSEFALTVNKLALLLSDKELGAEDILGAYIGRFASLGEIPEESESAADWLFGSGITVSDGAEITLFVNPDSVPELVTVDADAFVINLTININVSEPTTSEPTTSDTTSEPTTSDTTSEPTTSDTTSEPTTSDTTSEPTTSDTTSEPTTSDTTSEPTTSDTTSEPTTSDTTSEPTTSEPTTSEPTTSEPTTSEPTISEPTTSEPTTSEPTTSEPTTSEPTTSEPTTSEPTTSEPTTSEPTTSEPTTSEPTTSEPTTSEPTTSEPTTSEPTTSEPTTSEPTTSEPTTSEPTTSEPEPVSSVKFWSAFGNSHSIFFNNLKDSYCELVFAYSGGEPKDLEIALINADNIALGDFRVVSGEAADEILAKYEAFQNVKPGKTEEPAVSGEASAEPGESDNSKLAAPENSEETAEPSGETSEQDMPFGLVYSVEPAKPEETAVNDYGVIIVRVDPVKDGYGRLFEGDISGVLTVGAANAEPLEIMLDGSADVLRITRRVNGTNPVKFIPYNTEFTLAGNVDYVSREFSASGLPDGLTLNEKTGVISGIPENSGAFVSEISAEIAFLDEDGELQSTVITYEASFDVSVNSARNLHMNSDPNYAIDQFLGDSFDGRTYYLDGADIARDQEIILKGDVAEFVDLWINGMKLKRVSDDYKKLHGSTSIMFSENALSGFEKDEIYTMVFGFKSAENGRMIYAAQNFSIVDDKDSVPLTALDPEDYKDVYTPANRLDETLDRELADVLGSVKLYTGQNAFAFGQRLVVKPYSAELDYPAMTIIMVDENGAPIETDAEMTVGIALPEGYEDGSCLYQITNGVFEPMSYVDIKDGRLFFALDTTKSYAVSKEALNELGEPVEGAGRGSSAGTIVSGASAVRSLSEENPVTGIAVSGAGIMLSGAALVLIFLTGKRRRSNSNTK